MAVLVIPTMNKRNLERVRRSIFGLPERTLKGPITYRQVYKAKWGSRIPEDVCPHQHRTLAAAEKCYASNVPTP